MFEETPKIIKKKGKHSKKNYSLSSLQKKPGMRKISSDASKSKLGVKRELGSINPRTRSPRKAKKIQEMKGEDDESLDSLDLKNTDLKHLDRIKRKRRMRQNMADKLPVLYIPKISASQKLKGSEAFKSFKAMEGSQKFTERMDQQYPPDSLDGLKARLRYNHKAKKKYSNTYRKIQTDSMKNILNMISKEKNYSVKITKKKKDGKMMNLEDDLLNANPNKDAPSTRERKAKIRTYNLCWQRSFQSQPLEAREGSTFTKVGSYGWIIGGLNEKPINRIFKFDFETLEVEEQQSDSNNSQDFSRYGVVPSFNHTTILHKGKLFNFGGEMFTSESYSSRVNLNTIRVLNTKSIDWDVPTPKGDFIIGRKNHIAVGFSKYMLIHGGIDDSESVLNDTFIYNISKFSLKFR